MQTVTKKFISKVTFQVIPAPALLRKAGQACRKSFLKKDCGQAAMTELGKQCLLTNDPVSKCSLLMCVKAGCPGKEAMLMF